MSLRHAIALYLLNAAIVVTAGSFMPPIAEGIAENTGIDSGFVGTTFVALSTSLPELFVTLGAIKLGSFDMAAGNILGSNLFNLLILAIDDLMYSGGAIIPEVNTSHAISVLGAIAMTAILIIGMTFRAERKRFPWAWDTGAVLVSLALVLWFMHFTSSGPAG